MQDIDIADLLRRALLNKGCSSEQVGRFDGHSNIELELTNLPSLNVEQVEGDVWFWSSIEESSPALLQHCAADLLGFLMQGCSYARSNQMQLIEVDNRLELRVMLSCEVLRSEDGFAEALEAFLESITVVLDLIRR